MKTQKEQERTRCISCNRRIGGEGKPNKYGVCSNCHHKYFDGSEKHIRFLINLWKTAELKGIKEGKAQALADVMKIIDELLAKGLNGQRYSFMINGEELKAKLQSPQKENKEVKSCLFVAPNGDTNIQKAISEFKEIIEKEIKMWESDNKGKERYYGTSGCVVKVLEELRSKTAQEIK